MKLDHLAIAGTTLSDAVGLVEDALGVRMQPGGQHAVMGTHNALLGLEDGLYLEAIAIDPRAPKPDRARWFGLDRFAGPARLANWVCRSTDLAADLARLGPGAGEPVAVTRGDLAWRMAVPADGLLPFDGLHPAVMQWDCPVHPVQRLATSGCRLRQLTISHPDAGDLAEVLRALIVDPRLRIEQGPLGEIEAAFDTPKGRRILR
jgi:hypothetical protein